VQISENVQDMTTFLHILGQGKPLSAGYKAISVRILMKMQKSYITLKGTFASFALREERNRR